MWPYKVLLWRYIGFFGKIHLPLIIKLLFAVAISITGRVEGNIILKIVFLKIGIISQLILKMALNTKNVNFFLIKQ